MKHCLLLLLFVVNVVLGQEEPPLNPDPCTIRVLPVQICFK